VNPAFTLRIQLGHDIPVPAENTIHLSHIVVAGYAFLFVVVCIAAGVGTKLLVCSAMQYIIAFKTTLFHNVTIYNSGI
jgi:hypothetical protein